MGRRACRGVAAVALSRLLIQTRTQAALSGFHCWACPHSGHTTWSPAGVSPALTRQSEQLGFEMIPKGFAGYSDDMGIIAWVVFVPLQLLWLPISIIGSAAVGIRQLLTSRRLGVSQTAVEIINGRWAMDVFGLADQSAARRLAQVLPNTSIAALGAVHFPLWVARHIAGRPFVYPTAHPHSALAVLNFVPWRTERIDSFLDDYSDSSQYVILGSGLDTRGYGEPSSLSGRVWEVDTESNIRFKKLQTAKARLQSDSVTYVSADFSDDSWPDSMRAAGFDESRRTVFLLEGVSLYLTRDQLVRTLAITASLAPAGSVLLMDVISSDLASLAQRPLARRLLALTDEEVHFGVDFRRTPLGHIDELLTHTGLQRSRTELLAPERPRGAHYAIVEAVFSG